ncbi:MAG TPA: DnaA/Hda family protein, partial [Sphingomonas sp.]
MNDQRGSTIASEAERAWARVRASLRESAGARLFDQWLKPMALMPGTDAESIRLALPSAFMTNWVRNHYADRLMLEFRQHLPRLRSVSIETATPGPVPEVLTAPAEPVVVVAAPVASVAAEPAAERPVLDARYTFARFIVDGSNRVAFNAALAVAEPGPPRFSPLFLHAGTGQGKTHLMHAIAHQFLTHSPGARVLVMSAERFMFDFVSAMRSRDTFAFKQRLRSADLLLIDDLQFIAGKDATQE